MCRSFRDSEECGVGYPEHRDHERPIEVVVPHLTGCFGHQRAAVTCRAMKPAAFHALARSVVGTNRVIGAECPGAERIGQVEFDMTGLLDKPT